MCREPAYIFDLDGTLLKGNISVAFYFYALRRGFFPKRSLPVFFREALRFFLTPDISVLNTNIFFSLLKGLKFDVLLDAGESFAGSLEETQRYAPAFERLKAAQKAKKFTMILSSSPEFLVAPLARRWNCLGLGSTYLLDEFGCCRDIDVCLTGEVKALHVLSMKQSGVFEKIVCFSNGTSDLPFLYAGDEAVVVRPDRKLKKFAAKEGWDNI
ncbi:HAD family hydrolase [Chlamydiifrater phoenicopteri]|uniref:HAD family hydrolase n=1 Tax=Chlamydiifrater phoenicopteri TaxID=2681469 RepID=UPI001BCF5741|nr:haloacid dehalogenase-like hydrolase [Chlamydiifrater phoenicopteri]